MRNVLFKISLLDKISAPLRKVQKSFEKAKASSNKMNSAIRKVPNSIAQLEDRLSRLRQKQRNAFTVKNIKKYQKDIRKTEKELKRLNKQAGITKTGLRGMAVGGVGLYAAFRVGSDVINSWDKQKQAIAQVNQGLITTQGVSGKTLSQLEAQASALQKTSLFGDEDILQNVTAQILTFTNISGDAFDRTQQAALDLSARLGTDLKSSSIQLGKALNDPIANLSALSRSGIQFSDEQKELIKNLWSTGQQAEAQSIILDELERQYGGSAAAAAAAGAGPLKQLQMRFGDLKEKVGGLLFMLLDKLMPIFEKTIAVFEKLAVFVEKNAKVIGIIIGVIISAIAIFKTLSIIMKIVTAVQWALNIAMTANPIGAIIVGVAALIGLLILAWKKSEKFRATITGLWEAIKTFAVLIKDVVLNAIKSLLSGIGKMGQALWAFFKGDFKQAFEYAKDGAVDIVKGTSVGVAYDLFQNKDKVTNAFSSGYDKGVTNFNQSKADNTDLAGSSDVNNISGIASTDYSGNISTNDFTTGGTVGGQIADTGAITGGGKQVKNITITIDKLIEKFEVVSATVDASLNEISAKVTQTVLRAINAAEELA